MAMNVILFGASGMVGQGVLRECLLDRQIGRILSVARSPGALPRRAAGRPAAQRTRVRRPERSGVPAPDAMTFIYVSGAGTDSSERGRSVWARVKGATENALLQLPFKAAYMLRPGAIQPLNGIRSKTASDRILYLLLMPFLPVLRAAFPKHVTTTEQMGRAMLKVTRDGHAKRILEAADISAL